MPAFAFSHDGRRAGGLRPLTLFAPSSLTAQATLVRGTPAETPPRVFPRLVATVWRGPAQAPSGDASRLVCNSPYTTGPWNALPHQFAAFTGCNPYACCCRAAGATQPVGCGARLARRGVAAEPLRQLCGWRRAFRPCLLSCIHPRGSFV